LRDHALKKIIPNLQNYQQAAPTVGTKSTIQSSPTIQSATFASDLTSVSPTTQASTETLVSTATPVSTTSIGTDVSTCAEYFDSEIETPSAVASAKRRRAELNTGREHNDSNKIELEWDDRNTMDVLEEHLKRKQGTKKKCIVR
jgi:hypothetical protein